MDKVVHFEIPFDNEKKAKEFYSKVFGWKITEVPDMSYNMVHTAEVDENQMPTEAGAINGGMYERGEKGSHSPVIVIDVANIDEKIKIIKKVGGEITMAKVTVGDMGFYAQFKDSEGNILGIWEQIRKKDNREKKREDKEMEIEVAAV